MAWQKRREPEEKSDDTAKARAKAMEYLAAREHCANELYERLCRVFTEQAAAAAVAEMVERRYVDDERYAHMKARSLLSAHKSRREAARVMRQKGVDKPLMEAALEEIYCTADEDEPNPEVEAAAALIGRSYRRKLALGRRDLVVAALMRRGFPYAVIREALARQESDDESA